MAGTCIWGQTWVYVLHNCEVGGLDMGIEVDMHTVLMHAPLLTKVWDKMWDGAGMHIGPNSGVHISAQICEGDGRNLGMR